MQKQLIYIDINTKAYIDSGGYPITDSDEFVKIERGQWQVLCVQFMSVKTSTNGQNILTKPDLSGGNGFLFVADNDFTDDNTLMLKSYQSVTPFSETDATSNRFNIEGDWIDGSTADLTQGEMSIRINADTTKFAEVTGEDPEVSSGLYANIKQFISGIANPSNIAWFQFTAINTVRDWNEPEEVPPGGELHIPIIQSYLSNPFEYQFSEDAVNWHDAQQETDIYYRQRLANVEAAWSAAIQMVKGADGKDGTDGKDGADGASAYEVAQENGFEGTANEWLASLKGDPGDFDARGLASALSNYDDQGKGFTFYATDTGYFYSKNSDLSGDWSEAHYWGGPQGIQGPPGIQGPQGAIVTGGLDYAFTTTAETGNGVTFTLDALGVSSQCEWDVINSDGLNVTGDVRISRQWVSATEYSVTFAGGWPEGSWKLRPAGIKGNDGTTSPVVDHVYYNETYGTVIYLDDDNAVQVVGYQGDAWRTIELYLVSADSSVAGNIVLNLGENRLVAPVTATLSKLTWNLQVPTAGNISVTRNYIDSEDTLKDGDSVVTALLVDWRVK